MNLVPNGSDRTITSGELVRITGRNVRVIRQVIHNLISYGIPIVALRQGVNKGFYIATSERERSIGLVELTNQVANEQRRLNSVKNADLDNWQDKIKGSK